MLRQARQAYGLLGKSLLKRNFDIDGSGMDDDLGAGMLPSELSVPGPADRLVGFKTDSAAFYFDDMIGIHASVGK